MAGSIMPTAMNWTGGHRDLLDTLRDLRGMVILSGYASDLYDTTLTGWHRVELPARADGGLARTEILWINPQAWDRRMSEAA